MEKSEINGIFFAIHQKKKKNSEHICFDKKPKEEKKIMSAHFSHKF